MGCLKSSLCTLVLPDSYRDFESLVFNYKILKYKGSQNTTQRNTKEKAAIR
jgi:hypothetical protein